MDRTTNQGRQPGPAGYAACGNDAQRLRFLLPYAILAPSSHNTQPWLFRIGRKDVEIFADRSRALPVVDPQDRELVISCGAALGMMQVAMRRFGRVGEVDWLPPGHPDLLARVRLGATCTPTPIDMARFEAIRERRTTRKQFTGEPLPAGLEEELRLIGRQGGVEVAVLTALATRQEVADLVAQGDGLQFANPAFRRELAAWVHSRRAASRDGISGASFGMPDVLSAAGGLVIRALDMGDGIAAKDRQIAAASPALLVVAANSDEPRDWLATGAAHAQMLLAITAAGLTSAYLNQPVEVDELRPVLRRISGCAGIPQLLLRVGRGPRIPPAVRRPVEEVILAEAGTP